MHHFYSLDVCLTNSAAEKVHFFGLDFVRVCVQKCIKYVHTLVAPPYYLKVEGPWWRRRGEGGGC